MDKEKNRHAVQKYMDNHNLIKMTVYVNDDIYAAFSNLCVQRGDKKRFFNEALEDFLKKKRN